MGHIKSLSINLICIYVSVSLIFSPLQAQSKSVTKNPEEIFVLRLENGEMIRSTFLKELVADSLFIEYNGGLKSIDLNSITEIKRIKKSKIRKGLVIGGIAAGLISLGFTNEPESGDGGFTDFVNFIIITSFTISGMIIVTITGAKVGIDKNYDMTGWSTAQKKDKIQELIDNE